MATRPVVTPELYSGEGSFDEWLDHFDSVAKINGWGADEAAQWLSVRLVGRAKAAYKRLPDDTRDDLAKAKEALLRRFEPESKRSLYAAEFRARCKRPCEDWPTFADDLKNLVDKALPDLDGHARERLAVDRFLTQIADPQLAFSVRQRHPQTVDDAVAATLELQAHLSLANTATQPGGGGLPVSAVNPSLPSRPDRTTELLEQLVSRMEKLQTEFSTQQQPATPYRQQPPRGRPRYPPCYRQRSSPPRQQRGPVVCYRCGKEGHYARGCASPANFPQQQTQGN
jgi:hypothetical protein